LKLSEEAFPTSAAVDVLDDTEIAEAEVEGVPEAEVEVPEAEVEESPEASVEPEAEPEEEPEADAAEEQQADEAGSADTDSDCRVARPLAVAITGGIGAGKSTALESFRRHGAATVSSDEIVHHLLATDSEVKRALVDRLGEGILGDDGAPDRERIAFRVFKDRDALEFLESLLHPRVSREYMTWREQLAALPNPPEVCVTEVPLLYEVGAETRFDKVVVVTAPTKLREARRGGW